MDLNTALGTVSLGADGGPCRLHGAASSATDVSLSGLNAVHGMFGAARALLDEVQGQNQGRINYMLLSLILDLWRRNEYAYIALKDFAQYGDPEWAARIKVHSTLIGEIDVNAPIDWSARAELCNAIVHRLLDETDVHHQTMLDTRGQSAHATVGGDELTRIARHAHAGGHAAAGAPSLPSITSAVREVSIVLKDSDGESKSWPVQVTLTGSFSNGGVMVEGKSFAINAAGTGKKEIQIAPPTVDVLVAAYANGPATGKLAVTINKKSVEKSFEWLGGSHSELWQLPFSSFDL